MKFPDPFLLHKQETGDRLMGYADEEIRFMKEALELAKAGEGWVEPNPMVGALIVRDGRALGRGYHERFGAPHAEVRALEQARENARGATMYVTLEPCAHHGKTPPCAPALVDAGLARVVMAALDPTPKTRGRGLQVLREAGIRAEVGLCREEAVALNAAFFKRSSTGLPLVIAKWAMSADGKIATRTGSSRWISCEESRRLVHEIRGRVDAIVVGSRTVLRDNPMLTCRDAQRRRTALRVVLCGSSVPPQSSRAVQSASRIPLLLAYPQDNPPGGLDALAERGCEALPVAGTGENNTLVDPEAVLRALAARDASNVLVEGGSEVLGSFFERGLIDKAMIFIRPAIIGGADAVTAVGGTGVERAEEAADLKHVKVRKAGSDMLIEGWLHDPLKWASGPPAQ